MNNKHGSFWSIPTGWAALGLIAAASYFLLIEHTQHFFQFLPYLILLLCPLMHIFMHGKHHAQKAKTLAKSGWYARCRHPQYLAFILIMFGFYCSDQPSQP